MKKKKLIVICYIIIFALLGSTISSVTALAENKTALTEDLEKNSKYYDEIAFDTIITI